MKDRNIYACPECGHGEYSIGAYHAPVELIYNDEGKPVTLCDSCGEELTIEALTEPKSLTDEDIAYERAQNSLEWERMGGGGL
jgi:transcription elongation factor Elf1